MMASTRDSLQRSDDEEELVFDQTGLLTNKLSSRHGVVTRNNAVNSGGRLTVARTVNLCLSFFGLGLCFAIPTATIQDLQKRTNAEADIKHIYTARYGGYIFGCLIGGFLFDWYNRQFLLFLSIFATSIGIIVMPFCAQLATLMASSAITGITMGFLDTGGNVWCLDLWGRHSAPLMQALHFCFALGALVAPLIAEPFLSPASLSGISPTHNFGNVSLAPETYAHMPPIGIHHGIVVSRHHSHVTPHLVNSPPPPDIISRPRRSVGDGLLNSTDMQFPSFVNISTHNESDTADETPLHMILNSTSIESNDTSRIENSNGNQTTSSTPAPSSTTPAKKPTKPFYAEGPKKEDKWDRKSQKTAAKGPAIAASPNSTNSSMHSNATSSKLNSTTSSTSASVSKQSSAAPVTVQATLPPLLALNESSMMHSSNGKAPTETSVSNNFSGIGGESVLQGTNATLHVPSSVDQISPSTVANEVTTRNPATSEPSTNQAITTKQFSAVTTVKPTTAFVMDPPPKHDVYITDKQSYQPKKAMVTTETKSTTKAGNLLTTQHMSTTTAATFAPEETTTAYMPAKSEQPMQNYQPGIEQLDAEQPKQHTLHKSSSVVPETHSPETFRPTQPAVGVAEDDMPNGSSAETNKPSLFTTKSTLLEQASPTADTGLTSWITQKFIENRIGKLEFVYAILGAYLFIVSVVFLAFLCTSPRDSRSRQEEDIKMPGPSGKRSLVLLSSLFFFLYMGMEAAVGELLQIYASHSGGYALTYVFWGSFAAARFLAIPIAIKVSCRNMLLGDLGICFLASVLLVVGADRMESLLWTGVGVLGVGMASVLPTSLAWLERHMRVTNRAASVVLLGAAFGEMALPFLASHLIEREPAVLVYVNVSVVTLCCLNFGALWLAAAKRGEKYAVDSGPPDRSLYQLANLDDGDEQADFTLLRPLCANGENGLHFKGKQHRFSRGLSATS